MAFASNTTTTVTKSASYGTMRQCLLHNQCMCTKQAVSTKLTTNTSQTPKQHSRTQFLRPRQAHNQWTVTAVSAETPSATLEDKQLAEKERPADRQDDTATASTSYSAEAADSTIRTSSPPAVYGHNSPHCQPPSALGQAAMCAASLGCQ